MTNKYFDKEKLIIPNGEVILKVNCKYCLPCGICEFKSGFDRQILCNEFEAITFKLQNKEAQNND